VAVCKDFEQIKLLYLD